MREIFHIFVHMKCVMTDDNIWYEGFPSHRVLKSFWLSMCRFQRV